MYLSEFFWNSFVAVVSALLLACGALCYKSKCKELEICCIKIKRDVQTEEREHEFDVSHGVRFNSQNGINNILNQPNNQQQLNNNESFSDPTNNL
jgi:hypothetical protein